MTVITVTTETTTVKLVKFDSEESVITMRRIASKTGHKVDYDLRQGGVTISTVSHAARLYAPYGRYVLWTEEGATLLGEGNVLTYIKLLLESADKQVGTSSGYEDYPAQ